MQILDSNILAAALRSGIHRVILEQEHLNNINVFPVPDGDTGTNLSLSLSSALPLINDNQSRPLDQMLEAIADALLDGARGNSGAIMAQFFQGVCDSAEDLAQFSVTQFSVAVDTGNRYAHEAMAEPKEGTILSVIAAVAHSLNNVSAESFSNLFDKAVEVGNTALEKTTQQLEVLRKAGVVDAGAKGFVVLLEGMRDFISDGKETPKPDVADLLSQSQIARAGEDVDDLLFRYCTECVINGEDIDRRKLRESLSELGNSLVIAGTRRKARVHIHVNEPEQVFDAAGRFGTLSVQKADDMQMQQHSSGSTDTRFAVITDSGADIAEEDMERLDIHMIPMRVQFGDRAYLDKIGISADDFFRELETSSIAPTTSQPAPGDFRRQYQFLASHYPDVVSISVSGTVSGSLQAAKSAAGRLNAGGQVHLIDTLNASLGQGLVAVRAAECAAAGMHIDDALKVINDITPLTRTFAMVPELAYAVRGGRLSAWVKTVADLLHITPVLINSEDGRIVPGGVIPGRRNPLSGFARFIAKRHATDQRLRVAIGHAQCDDDAGRLAEDLQRKLPGIEEVSICELGAAIGVHVGKGSIVTATQPLD